MIFAVSFLAAASCVPVHGPVVRAVDLAVADIRFRSVPPDEAVGYSPEPGSRRMFSAAELAHFGKRFGLNGPMGQVCVEYSMKPLDSDAVRIAMERAVPGVAVEVLDTGNLAAPEGRLVFPLTSLPKAVPSRPGDPIIWRGYIEYAKSRRFNVWARVRLTGTRPRIFASFDIPAGREIAAGDVEIRRSPEFSGTDIWAENVDDLLGRRTLRSIRAGTPIPVSALQAGGKAIVRGDEVRVEIISGAARLKMDARAESNASVGDAVKLRNPKSGKIFEARVTGKGTAVLVARADYQGETL